MDELRKAWQALRESAERTTADLFEPGDGAGEEVVEVTAALWDRFERMMQEWSGSRSPAKADDCPDCGHPGGYNIQHICRNAPLARLPREVR